MITPPHSLSQYAARGSLRIAPASHRPQPQPPSMLAHTADMPHRALLALLATCKVQHSFGCGATTTHGVGPSSTWSRSRPGQRHHHHPAPPPPPPQCTLALFLQPATTTRAMHGPAHPQDPSLQGRSGQAPPPLRLHTTTTLGDRHAHRHSIGCSTHTEGHMRCPRSPAQQGGQSSPYMPPPRLLPAPYMPPPPPPAACCMLACWHCCCWRLPSQRLPSNLQVAAGSCRQLS